MDLKFGDALNESDTDFFSETYVLSSNPELRKLTRRFRIQRRLEKLQEGEVNGLVKSSLEVQLEESAKILTTLLREGDEIVTNVRVANDSREVDRREAECTNRQKVIEQLENEAVLGQEMFDEITNKWFDVFECNDPIHIHEELELQKERCNELIKQKDALIESLQDEVKKAEIKFTNDQQKQNEDVKSLGQRIEKQVLMMRNAFKEQLKVIEEVMIAENKTMYESNNRKWENLYVKTEKETAKQLREALDQMEKYQEGKKEIRLKFQETHRASKISLADAIQNLQLVQSRTKANVLLNLEILDYNYQVLRKKEDENLMISTHQKRQINKLQDIISGLKRKSYDYNIESNGQIENLKADVKKFQLRVIDLENKAANLSKINDRKYNQLWDVNVEDTTRTLNKILTIDKLIHVQHLGLPWQAPDLGTPNKHLLRSYCEPKEILRIETVKSQPSAFEETILKGICDTVCQDLHRHLLQQVAGKTDFLVEEKVQKILKPFLEDERMLVKIDNVFQALRLENVENVDLLFKFFRQYAKCHVCREDWIAPTEDSETSQEQKPFGESSTTSTSSENIFPLSQSIGELQNIIDHALDNLHINEEFVEEQSTVKSESTASEKSLEISQGKWLEESSPQENAKFLCEFGHPLSVHPSKVLKGLKQFVLMFNEKNANASTLAARLNQQYPTSSRLLAEEDVNIFWKQYRDVFGRSKEQLWDGLLFGLKQYYEILKVRTQMNDDVIGLRKQNSELKGLLHSYTLGNQKTVPYGNDKSFF